MALFDNVKAVLRPQPVLVYRNDRVREEDHFAQASDRYEVGIDADFAPSPVAYTAFAEVGRGPESRTAHMWRYTSLAIPEILSVMGWPFGVSKVPSALVVSMPYGTQVPLTERSNIASPKARSLGSITEVQGIATLAPGLSKITF